MNNLDRFDRMLLASELAPPPQTLTARSSPPATREPVITSSRGPRFVDHAPCPLCGVDRLGVEYHGVLMTGVKVHTITAHTAGLRRTERGQPRCLGAGLRIVFEGGAWKGVAV